MKLHNLFATALLLTATSAFAANDHNNGHGHNPHDVSEYTDQITTDTSTTTSLPTTFTWPNTPNTVVTVFTGNSGWDDYSLCGYDKDGKLIATEKLTVAENQTALSAADAMKGLDIDDEIKNNIAHFTGTHTAYQFAVNFGTDVASIGLVGGNNKNHLVYSITNNKTNNGLFFSAIDENGDAVYLGKDQWSSTLNFNNGAVFLVAETVGSPLPAPVTTLLIALAFGAAFVVYRNRKQVKA